MGRALRIALRLAVAAGLVGGAGLAAQRYVRAALPEEGVAAVGLRVDGVAVQPGERVDDVVAARVAARLAQRVELYDGDELVRAATVAELGAEIDAEALRASVAAIAHEGTLFARLDAAEQARAGALAISLPVRLPLEPIAATLEPYKAERDEAPVASRWDFAHASASPHRDGRLADADAAVAAIEHALRASTPNDGDATALRVALPYQLLAPGATREAVASIDRSALILRRETLFGFLGGQANRAQNVARAAQGVDGAVLMPGEVVSFNRMVGPRSADNGFAEAPEIYRGEMRTGVGGGTCQVAGTFYSTVYLAGLDIVLRSPHSRPIGYLPAGLDATVAYPHIDLRVRNGFDFPIVVHATAEQGHLVFELWGRERPAEVSLESATLRTLPFKRKITEAPGLPAGKVIQKKKGIRGLVVKKVRHIKLRDGERVEETKDTYPQTDEEFFVGPGTDLESDLPPLPPDAIAPTKPPSRKKPAAPASAATAAAATAGGNAAAPVPAGG